MRLQFKATSLSLQELYSIPFASSKSINQFCKGKLGQYRGTLYLHAFLRHFTSQKSCFSPVFEHPSPTKQIESSRAMFTSSKFLDFGHIFFLYSARKNFTEKEIFNSDRRYGRDALQFPYQRKALLRSNSTAQSFLHGSSVLGHCHKK